MKEEYDFVEELWKMVSVEPKKTDSVQDSIRKMEAMIKEKEGR